MMWHDIAWSQVNDVGVSVAAAETNPTSLWTRKKGNDWPRILGPNMNGMSSETGIISDWSKGLRVVWEYETGTGYSNCAVADGRAFQFDRFEDDERLVCLNAETGKELWRWSSPVVYTDMYGYNNGPRVCPVVAGSFVYTLGVAGRLSCTNVEDGKILWSKDINTEYHVVPYFFGVGASPVVYKNLLLVMVGGSPANPNAAMMRPDDLLQGARPNGCGMVAFDRATGREVYRTVDDLASYSSPIIANIGGRDWCLALMRGGLWAFDPTNGQRSSFFAWRSNTFESASAASPVVIGDKIFITETYEVGSALLEFVDGKLSPIWTDKKVQREQSFRAHWATPIVFGEFLFGCSGRNPPDAEFRCIHWRNGKVMWTMRTHERSTMLAVDDHLVVLGEEGQLHLVKSNANRADIVSEWDLYEVPSKLTAGPLLQVPSWAPPALAHGLLYLRGGNKLVCLELIPQE